MVVTRTQRLVFLHGLVVASPSLRPLRKLILGACAVHFVLLLEDLALQLLLLACSPRGRRRQS